MWEATGPRDAIGEVAVDRQSEPCAVELERVDQTLKDWQIETLMRIIDELERFLAVDESILVCFNNMCMLLAHHDFWVDSHAIAYVCDFDKTVRHH